MKTIVIKGRCHVLYEKTLKLSDGEAEQFLKECEENMDTAYCQIDLEDVIDIHCVDDGTVEEIKK